MGSDDRKTSGYRGLWPIALFVTGVVTLPPVLQRALKTHVSAPFIERAAPVALQPVYFTDAEGRTRSLGEFRGRTLLVNLWATWCIPCRRELPTLDRLQAMLGGETFQVVALSIDRAGVDAVRAFFRRVGISTLDVYVDESGTAASDLGAASIPTTLLINAEGLEVGRFIGEAEWDSPEMLAPFARIGPSYIRRMISA